jgi:hypothetical protein
MAVVVLAGAGTNTRGKELEEREQWAKGIRERRAQQVKELMTLAGVEAKPIPTSVPGERIYPWRDSKHLAILLLGDLRAPEAVPTLLENLEYSNPREVFRTGPLDQGAWFPAVEALIKIGMPAVDPVVERLGRCDAEGLQRWNCCWILEKILGPKLAHMRVQFAIEEARDAKTRENLQEAIKRLPFPQPKANPVPGQQISSAHRNWRDTGHCE